MAIQVEKGKTYTLGQENPAVPLVGACFTPPGLDEICFSLDWSPTYPTKIEICVSYGSDQDCYWVDFSSLLCIPIGIEGLGLEICFDNWNVQPNQVSFDIDFKICAFLCVSVASYTVSIPTSALADYRANKLSAEDVARLKKVLEIQRRVLQASTGGHGCNCK